MVVESLVKAIAIEMIRRGFQDDEAVLFRLFSSGRYDFHPMNSFLIPKKVPGQVNGEPLMTWTSPSLS